jgi:uncharacterized protein YcbK (DUF882 family)
MKPADWNKLKFFKPAEFNNPENMGYEFMLWLDALREEVGVPMRITSSYRSPIYNSRVGGATDSAHMDIPCDSVDIGLVGHPDNENYARYRIMKVALSDKFNCRRIGTYADGSLHLDKTDHIRPAPRIWRVVR